MELLHYICSSIFKIVLIELVLCDAGQQSG